jgi:hypothetical protein
MISDIDWGIEWELESSRAACNKPLMSRRSLLERGLPTPRVLMVMLSARGSQLTLPPPESDSSHLRHLRVPGTRCA